MSLILGYVNNSDAIIMSDGRAGENGSYSETYNKTLKINSNIILGFAGILESVEIFLEHCISQMGDRINEYYIEDFLELLKFLFDDPETQTHLKSSFVILGLNKENQFISCIAGDVTNYEIECNSVDFPRILAIGGTVKGDIINKTYIKNIENSSKSIEENMKETIMELSLIDSSINQNIFVQTIHI